MPFDDDDDLFGQDFDFVDEDEDEDFGAEDDAAKSEATNKSDESADEPEETYPIRYLRFGDSLRLALP